MGSRVLGRWPPCHGGWLLLELLPSTRKPSFTWSDDSPCAAGMVTTYPLTDLRLFEEGTLSCRLPHSEDTSSVPIPLLPVSVLWGSDLGGVGSLEGSL